MSRGRNGRFFLFACFVISIQSTFPLRLLYANRKDIRLLWTNGKSFENESVVASTTDSVAVDFLYTNHSIFWSDVSEQKIFSCSLKTSCKPHIIISGNLGRPEGLAVDWVSKKLYWTDYELKKVSVSSIDGKNRKTLIWRNVDVPRAIAVDPKAGLMFWSDWGEEPCISRAGMDGSDQTIIVNTFITWPNGLTLDYQNKKIYWVDAKHDHIASVDYHGNNRHMMYTQAVNHPYGLTMWGKVVYWTDWDTNSVLKCRISDRNSSCTVNVVKTKIYSTPMDIKVYRNQRQPEVLLNPCEKKNGGCSHLCLLAPGERYTCGCPSGIALKSDMKTCENGPQTFLLLAQQSEIRILSLSTEERSQSRLPIRSIRHVTAIDFDPFEKLIYWSDIQDDGIKCAHRNGFDVRTVVKNNNSLTEGLAIDWVHRRIYWTDAESDTIEMSYLNGSSRKVIVNDDLDEPRAIVVDPGERFIYWSDWGVYPKLERSKLDGTKREILINTSIVWPNGLVIDYQQRKLYWSDAKLDKIESCDLTGANRAILTSQGVPHVYGLSLVGEYLYWTDWQRRIVGKINKNNPADRKVVINFTQNVVAVKGVDLHVEYDL